MDFLVETVVVLGVDIQDTLEGWVLALFSVVIVFDAYLGIRDKRLLLFCIVQILGLIAGYYWASSVFEQQDVAGPWAWGRVVGIWGVSVVLFHAWYVLMLVRSRA